MSTRKERIQVYKDTLEQIQQSTVLQQSVLYSIENSKVYGSCKFFHSVDFEKYKNNVSCTMERSFEAAMRIAKDKEQDEKIAVLNFANAFHPGGGVASGASAQEESLCRCSTLLPVLISSGYLRENYYMKNSDGASRLIYSPDIVIFKTDEDLPKMMPESEWVDVDIITMAAPDLRSKTMNSEKLYYKHLENANLIFGIALENNVDHLILGAFGCGAFMNDPFIVAMAFDRVTRDYAGAFKSVTFAIFCGHNDFTNFEVFSRNLHFL